MPRKIQPPSPDDPYACLLYAAIEKTSTRTVDIAMHLGVNRSSILHWIRGLSKPTPANAALLAEILRDPRLAEVPGRRRNCVVCGKDFVPQARNHARTKYCGPTCYKKIQNRKWHRSERRQRINQSHIDLRVERNENERRRLAILEYCMACAGQVPVCPLIEGCQLIPVTELNKPQRLRKAAE